MEIALDENPEGKEATESPWKVLSRAYHLMERMLGSYEDLRCQMSIPDII